MVLSSQLQSKQQQPKPQYYLNQPSLVREKLVLPKHYHQFKIKNRQQKLQQQQQQQQRNPIELLKYQQGIRRICEARLQPQQQHSQHPQQQQQQQPQQQQQKQQQQQLQYYLKQFGRAHIQEYCQPSLVREQLKLPKNYHHYKLQNRQLKLQYQQQQKLRSSAGLLKYQKEIIRMCESRLNISQSLKQLNNINNNNNDKNNKNDKRVEDNDDINTNNINIKKKRNRDNDDENDIIDTKKKQKL
ncbi:hypothetical protein Glove_232g94 [Diversispora epigaea]|uniref:Uncharacterized protein n=1 Tax=Diversispora epigaea TaxID=1348612 RepID=A0A397IBY7_9GLOM|nr:hypothetical protein Glove_232g94 [Diversispora epigaea]